MRARGGQTMGNQCWYRVVRVSDSRTDQCGKPLRGVVDGDGRRAWHTTWRAASTAASSDASKKGGGIIFVQLVNMRESLALYIDSSRSE